MQNTLMNGIGHFGDGRFGDKSVIRHNTFDGSTFYVPFQKFFGSALGLRFTFSLRANKHPL